MHAALQRLSLYIAPNMNFQARLHAAAAPKIWYQKVNRNTYGIAPWHRSCPPRKKLPAISMCFEKPLLATTLFLYGQNYVPNPQPWTAIFSQSLQGFNLRHLTFLTLAKNRVAPNPASLLFFHCTFGASHFWNLTLVSCEWTIMHQGICQKTTTTVQILRRHHYLGTLTVYSTVTDS